MKIDMEKLARLCEFKDYTSFVNRLEFESDLLENAVNKMVLEALPIQQLREILNNWDKELTRLNEELQFLRAHNFDMEHSVKLKVVRQLEECHKDLRIFINNYPDTNGN